MDHEYNRETNRAEYGKHFRNSDQPEQTGTGAETARAASRSDSGRPRSYGSRIMLKGAAGHADRDAKSEDTASVEARTDQLSRNRDGIADHTAEDSFRRNGAHASYPSDSLESSSQGGRHARRAAVPKPGAGTRNRRRPAADTELAENVEAVALKPAKKGKKKKKRKAYTVTDVLKIFIPWRGDSAFEGLRKIIFTSAVCVVGVCTFLISSYYIDLYQAKKEYEDMQLRLEETLNNRSFTRPTYVEDSVTGEMVEYLEYNEIAEQYLSQNPDMVGYIRIKDTMVSYPVVQKKSNDINQNMNDYYLYRTFHQESSRSGCIFMDYRNHFDDVADHRRIMDNSENLVIYGHNMNNMTMFGSLRNYYRNPGYYMQHPVVELYSLYNLYRFKIFAVFITDGEDFDSEYAFDCWNILELDDEDSFYEFVNNAKKRTVINTDVDVEYGDQLLTLYTCHGLHQDAKLILLCRQVRDGEDPLEGTQTATLNDNVLYTQKYYNYGHPVTFDPDKFVPYGPKS